MIPCYSEPGGCVLDDEYNEMWCCDTVQGCALVRVYQAGWCAAMAEKIKDSQDE